MTNSLNIVSRICYDRDEKEHYIAATVGIDALPEFEKFLKDYDLACYATEERFARATHSETGLRETKKIYELHDKDPESFEVDCELMKIIDPYFNLSYDERPEYWTIGEVNPIA